MGTEQLKEKMEGIPYFANGRSLLQGDAFMRNLGGGVEFTVPSLEIDFQNFQPGARPDLISWVRPDPSKFLSAGCF